MPRLGHGALAGAILVLLGLLGTWIFLGLPSDGDRALQVFPKPEEGVPWALVQVEERGLSEEGVASVASALDRLGAQDRGLDLPALLALRVRRMALYLPLGDSGRVEVGEWVVAIGNPFGLENTVTVGVISAKNRTIQAENLNFQGFLQTDAAINPGNSGGPLLNLRGEVVGINTAIVPYAQGIGFAVPVNMAKQVMDDLIQHGEVKRGWMGVSVQSLTPAFAEAYGIPATEGAVVGDVVPGSPAERAGLTRGDVIVSLGDKKVKNSQDVVFAVRTFLAGDKVKLEYYRQKEKRSVEVTLGEIPGKTVAKGAAPSREEPGRTSSRLGATVSGVTEELQRQYRLPGREGVVVLGVQGGSFAQMLGLRPGDLVLEANRNRVRTLGDWERALGAKPKAVALLVWREGQTLFFSLKAQ